MATLYRERDARARRSRATQLAFYRHELRQSAVRRSASLAAAEQDTRRIQQLLPAALQAGMSVNEAVEVTGVSRATLYRMLSDARQQQDLQGLLNQFEDALARLTHELDWPPLPADLQRQFGVSLDEVFEMLMQLYRPLAAQANALGPIGLTVLGDLIPELEVPEKIVLNMLLFQNLPLKDVARSTQLAETRVLGWAALALLRLLPELRNRCGVDQA